MKKPLVIFGSGFATGFMLVLIPTFFLITYIIILKIFNFFKKKIKKNLNFETKISKQDEELIFSTIAEEIKTKNIKDSLYTKAYMIANADKKMAEVEYIKLRKIELLEEFRNKRARQVLEEKERKRKEKLERLRRSKQKQNIIFLIFLIAVFAFFLYFIFS